MQFQVGDIVVKGNNTTLYKVRAVCYDDNCSHFKDRISVYRATTTKVPKTGNWLRSSDFRLYKREDT